MSVRVSVVVPTYNRPELLERCLEALVKQSLDPRSCEIVIADDAGSDETRCQVQRWAERFRQDGPAIHYLAVRDSRGPAAARNAGWRHATGETVAFTDDDCVPDPDWLAAGSRAMRDRVVGVSGRVIVPLPENPTDYELNATGLATSQFVTANCFYRRQALEAVGGFDERFAMAWREDSDLYFTLLERGESLVFAPDAVVVHPVRPARWGISLSQQRKGQYNALLYKKHPRLFRERTQRSPRREYYTIVGALAGFILSVGFRRPLSAGASLALWSAMTAAFAVRRLRGTSKRPAHVAEMIVTSALIPPLAVYWRLRGAVTHRVWFL